MGEFERRGWRGQGSEAFGNVASGTITAFCGGDGSRKSADRPRIDGRRDGVKRGRGETEKSGHVDSPDRDRLRHDNDPILCDVIQGKDLGTGCGLAARCPACVCLVSAFCLLPACSLPALCPLALPPKPGRLVPQSRAQQERARRWGETGPLSPSSPSSPAAPSFPPLEENTYHPNWPFSPTNSSINPVHRPSSHTHNVVEQQTRNRRPRPRRKAGLDPSTHPNWKPRCSIGQSSANTHTSSFLGRLQRPDQGWQGHERPAHPGRRPDDQVRPRAQGQGRRPDVPPRPAQGP